MKITWGNGAKKANIVFVAISPSAYEKRTKHIFGNKKYNLLNKILLSLNFNKQNTYLTYIIKCKTPMNRLPTFIESGKCSINLIDELKLISPKIIILMGESVLQHFFSSTSLTITNEHGKIYQYGKLFVIPIINPIGTMTDNKIKLLIEDMTVVYTLYKSLFPFHKLYK